MLVRQARVEELRAVLLANRLPEALTEFAVVPLDGIVSSQFVFVFVFVSVPATSSRKR